MALHCCLGGTPAGFHVTFLKDRHFRFSVASKQVGLLVQALKRITSEHFDIYFHMWRDGGANWELEWQRWEKEEEDSWTTRISRKAKRKMATKKVSFHRKLVQDSPMHKSRPRELSSVIKIGDIFCPFTSSPRTAFGRHSVSWERNWNSEPSSSHSHEAKTLDVSVHGVFQNLKRDLCINNHSAQVAISQPPKQLIDGHPPQCERFNFSPNPATRFCFKCLSPEHLVKECRGEIRCVYCFNYGHRARFCAKRRSDLKYKWAVKPVKAPSSSDSSEEDRGGGESYSMVSQP
jgi:hypothetical protein